MNDEDPIGIIDLGNKSLKCFIFNIDKNNNLKILSSSVTPSEGIFNDAIVNLNKATNSIRISISEAEKKANLTLKKINIVFEQPDFLCTKFSKNKKINGSKIHRDDIEFLLKEAKKQLIYNDKNQSIIHIFNHNYIVDGKLFAEEPIDVFADSLSHEITFITVPKNNLKNINQAFTNCDIEIGKLFSRTFSLAVELLTHDELKTGFALINLENDKISLGIFKNLALVNSITLPIGINHITKDISKVCSLNFDESEIIRNTVDFLFENSQDVFDNDNFLKKNYFLNSSYRKISKDLILKVIKARLDEIFDILKKELSILGFNSNYGLNILLVGSGVKLKNIEKYCESIFNSRVKKIDINNEERKFSSCLGASKIIKDGWETEAIAKIREKNIDNIGFFSKIFGIFK